MRSWAAVETWGGENEGWFIVETGIISPNWLVIGEELDRTPLIEITTAARYSNCITPHSDNFRDNQRSFAGCFLSFSSPNSGLLLATGICMISCQNEVDDGVWDCVSSVVTAYLLWHWTLLMTVYGAVSHLL